MEMTFHQYLTHRSMISRRYHMCK